MDKTIKVVLIISLSLTISLFAKLTDKKDDELVWGMLYGDKHVFFVKAPEGWVLDNSSAVEQGLHAVFYPKGGSWEKSPTVMYARGMEIDTTSTLEDFIKSDIENFKKDFPGMKIDELDSILIKEKERVAKVFKFSGGGYQHTDAIAYIKEKENVSMIVITTKIPKELDTYYSKFIELVQSYMHVENYKAFKEKYGLE